MSTYKLEKKDAIRVMGSSRGSQIKFRKDGYWYKLDETGPEGMAEYLTTEILKRSNMIETDFVHYEACQIEYGEKLYSGCRSKDFHNDFEIFLSYNKIYEIMTGKNLEEDIIPLDSPKERVDFVCNVIQEFADIDVRPQISNIIALDMFTLNTDRHLNNIGIITDQNYENARIAPIFDNGAAFLSNYSKYPPAEINVDEIDVHSNVFGKPFAADLEYQAISVNGNSIRFDFASIKDFINNNDKIAKSRAGQIILRQVELYKNSPSLNIEMQTAKKNVFSSSEDCTEGISSSPVSIAIQMEKIRKNYFAQPKENRTGIEWNGEQLRPAVFEDMYLAQCKKEGREPLKEISEHFWKNCVEMNDYTPRFCSGNLINR